MKSAASHGEADEGIRAMNQGADNVQSVYDEFQ